MSNQLIISFEKLGIAPLTNEVEKKLFDVGPSSIEGDFNKATKEQLETLGIASAHIRGLIIQGRAQQFRLFKELLEQQRLDYEERN